jgi:hypothetical protein
LNGEKAMRRTASEIIRNLETRIARLENMKKEAYGDISPSTWFFIHSFKKDFNGKTIGELKFDNYMSADAGFSGRVYTNKGFYLKLFGDGYGLGDKIRVEFWLDNGMGRLSGKKDEVIGQKVFDFRERYATPKKFVRHLNKLINDPRLI